MYLGKDFTFQECVTWGWRHIQMLTRQVVSMTCGPLLRTAHLLEAIWRLMEEQKLSIMAKSCA